VEYDSEFRPRHGLEHHGIRNVGHVHWSLSTPALYEQVVRRREGLLAHLGPIVVRTGDHTGRSPNDKFIVHEPSSADDIWWSEVNRPFDERHFDTLYHRLLAYIQGKDLFIQDSYAGADPEYQIPIRVITEHAWQSLFARNMFIQIRDPDKLYTHVPEFRVLSFPDFHAVPEVDGTNSSAFIIVHFSEKTVMIGGTSYAGEVKKSIFTILNYLLPRTQVLSMHCSANVGASGDVALFFGLSGTGKTSLSADPERGLIGDDEHGWSDKGIFNFEGGCYAKVIRLSPKEEPYIYECTRRFGTVLENVAIDSETHRIDLDDASLTENTRAAYPITHIPNAIREGLGDHPHNILFLTCDAFGIMPPIAKLSTAQAMYHFLSGYTAKVAGTERDLGREPQAVFSACFGAPFMALPPPVYAEMLGERIGRHHTKCWLVNTGWIGGPFGVGHRVPIAHTRAMVRAILTGALDNVPCRQDPVFGFQVPERCPEVPAELMDPRQTWPDTAAYDARAKELAGLFRRNFEQFSGQVSEEVRAACPGQR